MCLLALLYRVIEDAPGVVGANREELYARGGEPPRVLDGRAVAGVDPAGGGTWLGLNADGVLIAVTNRRKSVVPPSPRSRGLLARDLLGHADAADAADAAAHELRAGQYAGCNVLCADAESAAVVHAGDDPHIYPLTPGVHVLTNGDVNDDGDPRLAHARRWLSGRTFGCSQQGLTALEELCGRTGGDGPAICLRGADRGTVSSTLVAVRRPLATSVYLHAQGPPDRTAYVDYSTLLRRLILE